MPDTIITASFAKQHNLVDFIHRDAAKALRDELWENADSIEIATREASTAFGLVWGVMEDLSRFVVKATDEGSTAARTKHDQLYLLLNAIDDRLGNVRKHAATIQGAAGSLSGIANAPERVDAVVLRHVKLKALEKALDDEPDAEDGPRIQAYHDAQDRFIEEPATTFLGILTKLERITEVENLESHGAGLLYVRVILNLIRDLKAVLDISDRVAAGHAS